MVRVLLVVTNHGKMGDLDKKTGWYLPEVAHPYLVFKNAGYEIIMASPKGGNAPMDPSSFEAFEQDEECKPFRNEFNINDKDSSIKETISIDKVDVSGIDVIFCVGGHGPMFDFPKSEVLNKAVASVYEKGGIVAAVCHGPAGIVDTKLSNGDYLVKKQKVTCFTNKEEEFVKLVDPMPFLLETRLGEHGAEFLAADLFQPNVVKSGRIVTGQNPASATPMCKEIVDMLNLTGIVDTKLSNGADNLVKKQQDAMPVERRVRAYAAVLQIPMKDVTPVVKFERIETGQNP